jgi:3-oxoacyl-[acyl-carrier protein] reductase
MDITGRLAGKVALVTGGSRGIGAEITRRLAAEGADVAFTYRTGKDEADSVAGQVRSLGRRAFTVRADLAEPTAAGSVADAAAGEFGKLDVLVNNAGITHWGSVAQTSLEDFDRLVAVNARAPFLMMQAAASRLGDGGRVVNISSGVTSTALAGSTATGPFAALTEGQKAEAGASFGLGRIGEPADTAAVVAVLVSAEAGFITGQVVYVTGGQLGPIRRTG